jgi:putative transposase
VDGGTENINQKVNDYIQSKGRRLIKLIAGKDIRFSNSMVEAQNRLIKYHYLFRHPFSSLSELNKLLEWIIQDYNHTRPHHSLGGLTPYEALNEITISTEDNSKLSKAVKSARVKENIEKSCGIC